MTRIGLLHTAASHVDLFDRIARSLRPDVGVVHEVCPALLSQYQVEGASASLLAGLNAALSRLTTRQVSGISCSCSTLGELVEHRVVQGIPLQRIDRAAADAAMEYNRVLVVAAIPSAAEAADRLLKSSAHSAGSYCRWRIVQVPDAWALFEAGDLAGYEQRVAEVANQWLHDYDAVFLSQASMIGAVALCRHRNVLTSPVAGIRVLLESVGS